MTIQRVTLSYDSEKHSTVHLGLLNHGEDSDSAYLRKCVEFFELNKGGVTNQQLIIERLTRIESLLKNGVTISGDVTDRDDETQSYEILDDLLEQLE
jgi:hypothetical protein